MASFLGQVNAAPSPAQKAQDLSKKYPGYNMPSGGGIGGAIGRFLGFDPTPGFNITRSAGGGIPFISKGNGSTGKPPAAAPIATPNPSAGGNTDGTLQPLQTVDPYAAYGGTSAYNNMRSGFGTQHQQLLGSYGDAIAAQGAGLGSSVQDLLDSYRAAQTGIDRQAVQNELAKKQGTAGVLSMVGQGIKSGGVTLANKNATTSSATDALARAYADIGRRSLSDVGNQYAQGVTGIQNAEADLATQQAQGARKLQENKTAIVNNIVSDAQQKLAALDAQIASANLPDRINIESEKEQIRQQALGALQQYDQQLAQGTAAIRPQGIDQARAEAARQASLGVAPENAFNFTTQVPTQFQNTGPFASELPIFTFPGSKKQNG